MLRAEEGRKRLQIKPKRVMMRSVLPSAIYAVIGIAVCSAIFVVQADEIQSTAGIGILVETGKESDAHAYYKRISSKLGVSDTEGNLADLSALLAHFGLSSFSAERLEASTPSELASTFPNDQVLAARFFAPKIVDFNSQSSNPAYPFNAGWRKLVRIAALPGSKADSAGLAVAYILYNYVQKDPSANPFPDSFFKIESFNNQVIIVPKQFQKGTEDSAFFLDYDIRSAGYKIHLFLSAAFDTAPSGSADTHRNYYVPIACAQCHGHDPERGAPIGGAPIETGTFPFVKVNYLDTDHWYDIAAFGDFPSTNGGTFDVLFDGTKDHTSSQYGDAVGVFRKLNAAIRQQNIDSARADGTDLFKTKAVEKWLSVHERNNAPVAPIDRALDLGNGAAVWENVDDDKKALAILDHYCFRCHSSVLYDVFDKQGVLDEKTSIIRRVQLPPTSVQHMPQGRVLDSGTIADLVNLIRNLKK